MLVLSTFQQMLVSSLLSQQITTNYHSKRKKEANNNTLITKTNSFPSPLVYTNHRHHILNTKTNKHRINLNIEIIVIIYTQIFDCKLYYHDHTEACETLLTTLLPS